MTASVDNFAGLLLSLKMLNRTEEYKQIYSQLVSFVNERNNPAFSTVAYSLRARLSLLENDIKSAIKLIKMADMFFDSGNTQFFIESPRLTYCRVLLARNNKDKTEEAIEKLETHLDLAVKTRNAFQLIRIHILRAVAFNQVNRHKEAIESLLFALKKAQPGNWILPFIEDGGAVVRVLLSEVTGDKNTGKYASMLLNEFSALDKTDEKESDKTAGQSRRSSKGFYQLTNRELDIIHLLAKRLSNKEIASELFISETTVKRHAINIYQKLGVNKRRDAVLKVEELGFLSRSKHLPL
jgi:LuxR family maltose regulon positive regulatory protein